MRPLCFHWCVFFKQHELHVCFLPTFLCRCNLLMFFFFNNASILHRFFKCLRLGGWNSVQLGVVSLPPRRAVSFWGLLRSSPCPCCLRLLTAETGREDGREAWWHATKVACQIGGYTACMWVIGAAATPSNPAVYSAWRSSRKQKQKENNYYNCLVCIRLVRFNILTFGQIIFSVFEIPKFH